MKNIVSIWTSIGSKNQLSFIGKGNHPIDLGYISNRSNTNYVSYVSMLGEVEDYTRYFCGPLCLGNVATNNYPSEIGIIDISYIGMIKRDIP